MYTVASTRRVGTVRAALAGLTTIILLTLSACGSGEPSQAANPSSSLTPQTTASTEEQRDTVTITDELGREVELQLPVRKVYPDLWYQTEILRAIGVGDAIVAVDDTAHPKQSPANAEYFANLSDLPSAGNYDEPNWEAIVESGAEVYFARRNSPWQQAVEKLEPFGIKVVIITTWDPIILREYLPLIGQIFGAKEGAAKLATLYDDIDATLKERLANIPEKKTVYFENNADFVTSTPGSGWHDTIELGGGINIFEDINAGNDSGASVHQYTVDPVSIVERNPDAIIRAGALGQSYGYQVWEKSSFEQQAQQILSRPAWNTTTAVTEGNIFLFNNFYYSALGKQFGALAVAKWLYPEQFADVNIDDYFARWLEPQGVSPVSVDDYLFHFGQ